MKRLLIAILAILSALPLAAQLNTRIWYPLSRKYSGAQQCYLASQANVVGGVLQITASTPTGFCVGNGTIQSAQLNTSPFYFQYGKVIITAQFAPGQHTTLWMWGGDTTSGGYPPTCLGLMRTGGDLGNCINASTNSHPSYEVDMAEYISGTTAANSILSGIILWNPHTQLGENTLNMGVDPTATYNTYETDWTPASFTFKANGVSNGTFSQALAIYMFPLITVEPGDGNTFPQVLNVTSFKVYCTSDTTYPAGCTPGAVIFDGLANPVLGAVQSQGVTKGVVQ